MTTLTLGTAPLCVFRNLDRSHPDYLRLVHTSVELCDTGVDSPLRSIVLPHTHVSVIGSMRRADRYIPARRVPKDIDIMIGIPDDLVDRVALQRDVAALVRDQALTVSVGSKGPFVRIQGATSPAYLRSLVASRVPPFIAEPVRVTRYDKVALDLSFVTMPVFRAVHRAYNAMNDCTNRRLSANVCNPKWVLTADAIDADMDKRAFYRSRGIPLADEYRDLDLDAENRVRSFESRIR